MSDQLAKLFSGRMNALDAELARCRTILDRAAALQERTGISLGSDSILYQQTVSDWDNVLRRVTELGNEMDAALAKMTK